MLPREASRVCEKAPAGMRTATAGFAAGKRLLPIEGWGSFAGV